MSENEKMSERKENPLKVLAQVRQLIDYVEENDKEEDVTSLVREIMEDNGYTKEDLPPDPLYEPEEHVNTISITLDRDDIKSVFGKDEKTAAGE
jgi:hypothetical protein